MKIFFSIALFALALLSSGCSTTPKAHYKFSMTTPKQGDLHYEDDKLNFTFMPVKGYEVSGFTMYTAYEGVSIIIKNKTSSTATIDWNQISFTDSYGSSGHTIMHNNIKYTDCPAPKTPSIIPPNGTLNDTIIPCYATKWLSAGQYSRWQVDMLPDPAKSPSTSFGIFMPIKIGENLHDYNFTFYGNSTEY